MTERFHPLQSFAVTEDCYALTHSYFVRPLNELWLHNPKAGSTTLEMFFARLEGRHPESLCDLQPWPEVRWEQAVHSLRNQLDGHFGKLDSGVQKELRHSREIHRIGFVRDPLARFWSSWASKVLIREPLFRFLDPEAASCSSREWLDRIGNSDGVVREFRRFLREFLAGGSASEDPHFLPQSVIFDGIPDETTFFDLRDLSRQLMRLGGATGTALPTKSSHLNQSLVQVEGVFGAENRKALEEYYFNDYAIWGHLWLQSPKPRAAQAWTAEELEWVAKESLFAQRLQSFWSQVITYESDLAAVRTELK